jgi:protein-tyrosine phosphatase
MPRILIICTANICRSPVAEAILRDRLQKQGLGDWVVSSAGTWAVIERGAARYSVELMADRGFDLEQHQARMVEEKHLSEADLVLCMESGHVEALKAEFPRYADKIRLLSEMVDAHYSIDDPYGQPKDAYRDMIAELSEIIDNGLSRIVTMVSANAANRKA